MPFNQAAAIIGGRNILLQISSERTTTYDVELELVAAGFIASRATDRIVLEIIDVDVIGNAGDYSVDGNDLHNSARLTIDLKTTGNMKGRGGRGGNGGNASYNDEEPGEPITSESPGNAGGVGATAFRAGCITEIIGNGEIRRGYGGGGGGSGNASGSQAEPGSGGGGGAALRAGGNKGSHPGSNKFQEGTDGSTATNDDGGPGGTTNRFGGAGGDTVADATAGVGISPPGGSGGANGDAIHKNGFAVTVGGDVTVTGPIIA